ncbi:uncharacterized protein troap isoform 1-T3 [Anableps anableps]
MDSSSVLRQQSQNKIRSEFQRMKNEHNAKRVEPKLSEVMSSLHLSKKDVENKDPGEPGRKPPLQPGGSRLPVLAKSLKLQTPSEFKQTHKKWEEKPLSHKTKKRPCTRPVPFNFSQRKTRKRAIENGEPLTASQSRTPANQPEDSACKIPSKYQDVLKNRTDSVKALEKSHGKAAVNTAHLSGQPSPKLKTSAPLKNTFSTSGNTVNQNVSISSSRAHLHPEVSLDLLGDKEPPKISLPHQTVSLATQVSCSKPLNEKSENFQPDHAALLSILRNENVGHANQPIVTPKHSKQYNYLPQRVSVMKSQQRAGTTAGPVRAVQFSPDAAALRSILQNEGVKGAGPVGAMSRNSVCPPGRGTSIYTAQRVPVKKSCPDSTSRPVAVFKETTQTKWTPQRVHNIKHQPMSAMKWYPSPCGTLRHGSCKSNIHPRQEEVVQRLFDDPEDEQSTAGTGNNPSVKSEQISVSSSSNEPLSENTQRGISDDEEEELKTFLQAPPRESVIFFSTGKKLIRAPRFENQGGSAQQEQHDPALSEQRKLTAAPIDVSEPAHQINSVQHLHRVLIPQKPCSLNPAVAMLRKRFPPLEELRMDEEVATYTSVSAPGASGFVHPQPRCGNPLASVLHFEESTRFVPIDISLSCGPSSMLQSSQHKR